MDKIEKQRMLSGELYLAKLNVNSLTIGAGSVVVKDIPPKVVAAGNPCRVIKYLS